MDPATIGLLISIAPSILELLFGKGTSDNNIKHKLSLENSKEMYGYGLEGYGLDDYGLGFRYPTVPYIEVKIPRKSKTGTDYQITRKIPQPDEKWIATYLLNTQKKPPRRQTKWMDFVKQAIQQAKVNYDNYLNDLKKTDKEAYDKLMKNRKMREARKQELPLAIRLAPGALELYNQFKDLPPEELLGKYYLEEEKRRIPKKYRQIVLAVKQGQKPPTFEEALKALAEQPKRGKKTQAKK
jgi:hypothetical protein